MLVRKHPEKGTNPEDRVDFLVVYKGIFESYAFEFEDSIASWRRSEKLAIALMKARDEPIDESERVP